MDSLERPKVCLVGAGVCGLISIKHLKDVCDLECFEMQSIPGGLWNYTDVTDDTVDKTKDFYANMYGHNYASMYKNLISVGPKVIMRFKDMNDKIEGGYFTVNTFREHLEDMITKYNLTEWITFNTAVTNIEVNKDETNKHWKVTIQAGINGETEIRYYDYVIVANGHDSVPFIPTSKVNNLDTFQGKIMHSHNFRTPDWDDFNGKNILIVGAKFSGLDILYKFLGSGDESKMSDFKTITVWQGKFGFLQHTTNFRKYIDEGKIIVKTSGIEFKANSVVFEDGSEQDIDAVIFWTGYRHCLPFLKNTDLFTIDAENRYIGPLFKRYWWINDPKLMLIGLNDGTLDYFVTERNLILTRHYLQGTLKLPSREEMIEDMERIEKLLPDKRSIFQAGPSDDRELVKDLYKFYSENVPDPLPYNDHFIDTVHDLLCKAFDFVFKGDWDDFKHTDITDYNVLDSTEYF